jgi:poly(glycerol-phosphate) alpha-glucosyltransferase
MPDGGVDPRLVVGVGQLRPMKRWDDAVRVMARVVTEVPSARLVVHGVGDDRERLLTMTKELGMSDSVAFPGYTTTPLAAMAAAACTISTTRREAMPLTLLESLSVGTPPVVYDVRYGPDEIVRDGVDGFVVPGHDVAAAADAVVRLLTEPDLRERMSLAAHDVSIRFSRDAHDRAWLALGLEVSENGGMAAHRP